MRPKLEWRTVLVRDIPARIARAGSGPPVWLLHGLAGSTAWWERNVPALAERHTVFLLDLPGFGSMRRHRKAFVLEETSAWVKTAMDAMDVGNAALMGHSMGGLIAACVAADYPAAVNKLVLVAPAITLPHTSVRSSLLPLAVSARYTSPAFFPTLVVDSMRAGALTLLRSARQLLSIDLSRKLGDIKCPVLLVWGARDTLVPLTVAERVRESIPHARLEIFDGAGHVVMFDRAPEFNRLVLEFL